MYSNKEIANQFNLLAKLMELHDENTFKIRSYSNAYLGIRKMGEPLAEMDESELAQIRGIGKAVASKIVEFVDSGSIAALEKYKSITPEGIQQMLSIKGLGPKKIKVIWKDLGVESPGELYYACVENRLVELKGFGLKTQDQIKKQMNYFFESQGKFHYAVVEAKLFELEKIMAEDLQSFRFELCGKMRSKMPIVESIDFIIETDLEVEEIASMINSERINFDEGEMFFDQIPINFISANESNFASLLFEYTGSDSFLDAFEIPAEAESEQDIFDENGCEFIEPELRDSSEFLTQAREGNLPDLIEESDIKGVVHNHSTYSDGIHSLKEMSDYVRENGYEYFVISDHSKSAFYANGLSIERVEMQWREIDSLNASYDDFRVFKSIESDILSDGSLDYPKDILDGFDLVIASIHSNLKMDIDKATNRLIKAIENPATRILGHPTGRLLLSREGYPIDHEKIIDAAAANNVVIELNANPHRLDLDWRWIKHAYDKNVMISINPDAHSKSGIHDIRFGVLAARKAGLSKEHCLNSKSLEEFNKWVLSK